ncbi:MAG: FkbM family methyltransferase [Sedimentisphaerales bacterium]|nr:FkbM family methyltransferase [Sedimentisphaerales bacterium]
MFKQAKPPREVLEEREKAMIREYFGHMKSGVVVEVGANEPATVFSQSWHLEQELGWRAVLVEPYPQLAEKARRLRPNALVFECACCAEETDQTLYVPLTQGGEVTSHAAVGKNLDGHHYHSFRAIKVRGRPLTHILNETGVTSIDLLSIDVEGAEMEVLNGFDLHKHRPRLILLEDKHYALNKHRHLVRHGYRLCKRTGFNCWYIPKNAAGPKQDWGEKLKIFKRLYISIWWKKLKRALRPRY